MKLNPELLRKPFTHFVVILALFAVGASLFMAMFERLLKEQVQSVTELSNVTLTRLFVNEAWAELRPMLDLNAAVHPRDNPALSNVDMRVRRFAKGSDLIKVKIYNVKGLTVYSSDPAQLGEDKSDNKGFLAAVRGKVVSETTNRGKFGAFDGEIYDRNLVSSYVPVRGTNSVDAVVELYADRTTSIKGVEEAVRAAWLEFGPFMLIGFILVWLLSRPGLLARRLKAQAQRGPDDARGSPVRQREAAEAEELLHQATAGLTQERERLAELVRAQARRRAANGDATDTEPDMASLLELIDALSLIQRPEQVLQVPPGTRPLRARLDAVLETVQARYSQQGVELTTHVAPAMDTQVLSTSPAIVHLVKLLLDDAVHRTESGTVRLSVQPGHDNFLHIDVVGTRRSPVPAPADAPVGASIPAKAAQALAQTIGGRIEKFSMTDQGPWASVIVPMNP